MPPSNIFLLTLIVALFYLALGSSAPIITLYLEEMGASYSTIAWILASYGATVLLSNYAWGRLSDRLGRRKPLVSLGLAGLALAYGVLSMVETPALAWLLRIVEGCSVAAYATTSLAFVGDLLETLGQRGRRMGTYRGAGSLAFAAGAMLSGRLADSFSIAATFRFCALIYLLALLASLRLRDLMPAADLKLSGETSEEAATPEARLPWPFLGGVFLFMSAFSSSASMWPNYMNSVGYTKTSIGTLWSLAALVEAPVMRYIGALSDTVGRAPVLASGTLLMGLVMAGYMTLSRRLLPLIGVQVIRGFAVGSYMSTSMTFTAEWGQQRQRGNHSGLYNAVGGSGQLVGLLLSGNIVQLFGFHALFAICGLATLMGAVCFWLLGRQPHRIAGPIA